MIFSSIMIVIEKGTMREDPGRLALLILPVAILSCCTRQLVIDWQRDEISPYARCRLGTISNGLAPDSLVFETMRNLDSETSGSLMVSRVVISSSSTNLSLSKNWTLFGHSTLPLSLENPHMSTELLSLGKNATVRIKRGNRLTVRNIRGSQDARALDDRIAHARLIGFTSASPGARKPLVRLFVRVSVLPGLPEAEALVSLAYRSLGTDVIAILRTDSYFAFFGGPSVDMFEEYDNESDARVGFQQVPYMACAHFGESAKCRTERPYERTDPIR